MNKILFQLFLALLSILLLFYSRVDVVVLPFFVAVFFLMVFLAFKEKKVFGLVTIAAVASLVLALRFRYLTWGDPWNEYAMILRLIEYGSLGKEIYPSQQPAMHLSIAELAIITKINPMALQKFVVPLFSVLSILFLYKFVKDYFRDKELGLLAGLLLLVGTPYLHWTTQAVRESLGLPMFLMAFYFSYKAIKSAKLSNLLVSIILITGLVLTHNFSTMIFIISWLGFSIAYVYLHGKTRTFVPSLGITLFTIIAATAWWGAVGGPLENFVKALKLFLPDNSIVALVIFAGIMYALPSLIPGVIKVLRRFLESFLEERVIQGLIIFIALFSAIIVVNLVRGKSFLILNYPGTMMLNGIVMILLSIVGLYFLLNLRGIPFLAWIAALALPLVFSIQRVFFFGDPLRFIEYLYIPIAIVAGAGLKQILVHVPRQVVKAGLVAGLASVSLVTAFPAVVFWGTPFEEGSILYDDRSWIIYHPNSEIKAVEWLDAVEIKGYIYSDNYVYYGAQWINSNDIVIEKRMRLRPQPGSPKEKRTPSSNSYLLVTERMQKYVEFHEGMMHERYPLQESEIEALNKGTSIIYNAGGAKIYYINKE